MNLFIIRSNHQYKIEASLGLLSNYLYHICTYIEMK